ncbi:MAG: hypothetical protein ABIG08_00945 [bacterium]
MKKNERVLVVARETMFQGGCWQGLKRDNLEHYLDLIRNNFQFKLRSKVENDSSWQQIIPYILFNFQDRYFVYRYLEKASEERLKKDYHLGVAGHINPIDSKPGEDILEIAAKREWDEEIEYKGKLLKKKLIGILNDERREVEAVHLGLIYLFEGDSPEILVKEKDVLKGELVKLNDLGKYVEGISNWAQIIYKEYLLDLWYK